MSQFGSALCLAAAFTADGMLMDLYDTSNWKIEVLDS